MASEVALVPELDWLAASGPVDDSWLGPGPAQVNLRPWMERLARVGHANLVAATYAAARLACRQWDHWLAAKANLAEARSAADKGETDDRYHGSYKWEALAALASAQAEAGDPDAARATLAAIEHAEYVEDDDYRAKACQGIRRRRSPPRRPAGAAQVDRHSERPSLPRLRLRRRRRGAGAKGKRPARQPQPLTIAEPAQSSAVK